MRWSITVGRDATNYECEGLASHLPKRARASGDSLPENHTEGTLQEENPSQNEGMGFVPEGGFQGGFPATYLRKLAPA